MLLVSDLEAPNLDPDYIHCFIGISPIDGQMYEFHDKEEWSLSTSKWMPLSELKGFLETQVSNLIGHNFRRYDIPALQKIYGLRYRNTITDTLVWSKCLYPDRPRPSGYGGADYHGLGSWGFRLGRGKPENEDWSKLTEHMLHRCREDVEINLMVWRELLWEMFCRNTGDEFVEEWAHTPPEYPAWVRMEEKFASIIDEQARHGVQLNEKAARDLLTQLNKVLVVAEDCILPILPSIKKVSYKEKAFPDNLKTAPITKQGKLHSRILKYYKDKIAACSINPESLEDRNQIIRWLMMGVKVSPEEVVTYREMKIKSPQFKDWLLEECGWQPTEWNLKKVTQKEAEDPSSPFCGQQAGKFARDERGKHIKASPKLTEDSFESIRGGHGPMVKEYLMASHRASLLTGLLENIREDGTIGADADSCGASTTRVKHRVVANIPRIGTPYGEDLRALFTAREGRVLVGADADALEARVTGHYTTPFDDGEYARELLEGDVHTKNALAFGLVTPELVKAYRAIEDTHRPKNEEEKRIISQFSSGRNGGGEHGGGAKAGLYCLSYGGQAPKLAETLNKPVREGEALFQIFWENNPGLAAFKEAVLLEWKSCGGWIKAIDGRWLKARSPHSLVNLKIQSGGSILCKTATVFLHHEMKRQKLDAHLVINYHDEYAADSSVDDSQPVKGLMEQSFERAGKYWGFLVPTPGKGSIGNNWLEIH